MNYRFNEEKYFVDITDGIAILINVESGVYFGMNTFTTSLFENIMNGADTDELLDCLSKVKGYNDEAKNKYASFIEELSSKEVIIEDADASAEVSLDIKEYTGEEEDFVLSEYQDVADLLLADPIHQVKEEVGWGPGRENLK